jgi:undecaprenyl-diphosphatase
MTTRHSMLNSIVKRDHRLMRRANNWRAPRWIRLWMIVATRGGDGWLWYAMGLAVLLFGGPQRFAATAAAGMSALVGSIGGPQRFAATAAAGMSALVGSIVFLTLKRKTKRRRPCHLEPHCWAKLLPPDQFSFPSGHTITAFAVAMSLGLFYPNLLVGLLFCAFSIGISRILLGMHFLSDVVVGGSLGAALGYVAYVIYS